MKLCGHFVLVTSLLLTATTWSSAQEKEYATYDNKGKYLSLFNVASSDQKTCTTNSNEMGTCMTVGECRKVGVKDGTCSSGFGVCCVAKLNCDSQATLNNTYFQNPDYSSGYKTAGTCEMTLNKNFEGICQVRIDFLKLELAQPTSVTDASFIDYNSKFRLGACEIDWFRARGGVYGTVNQVCGINTGSHMYMDVSSISDVICQLGVFIGPELPDFERYWNVKVALIPCDSSYSPPSGCTQYYSGVGGIIESFNFNSGAGIHLQVQSQHICIRPEAGYCSIDYWANPAVPQDQGFDIFALGQESLAVDITLGGLRCSKDYLIVPGAERDRYCGRFLNKDALNVNERISTSVKPFGVTFITNALEEDENDEFDPTDDPMTAVGTRGFSLRWLQNAC